MKKEMQSENLSPITKTIKLDEKTKSSITPTILQLKNGVEKLNRQMKFERENIVLEFTSIKANFERELFLQIGILKQALETEWKVNFFLFFFFPFSFL